MTQLVRDSIFGQFLHLVSGGKLLPSEEQKDPSLWQTRVLDEKSVGRNRQECNTSSASSTESSKTIVVPGEEEEANKATASSRADAEKGADHDSVDWYGPQDPEVKLIDPRSVMALTIFQNPRNWSTTTKFFVTFELCLFFL